MPLLTAVLARAVQLAVAATFGAVSGGVGSIEPSMPGHVQAVAHAQVQAEADAQALVEASGAEAAPLGQGAAEPPAPGAAAAPAPPPADGIVDPANPVHALLLELEKATDGLETFTAQVHHTQVDALLEERVMRMGTILYRIDPADGERAFVIAFDKEVAQGRLYEEQKRYVFKGRWLVEVDPEDRIYIRREIAPPGEVAFDPLELGEGPFPLPVGQSAQKVLERFDVSFVDLPAEGPLARLREGGPVDGVRLVPRPGLKEARDIALVDVYYDRATRLPVGVRLLETNDDEQIARLTDLVRNPELGPDRLSWLDITPPDPREWSIDIR